MQSANPRRVGRYEILASLAQGGMAELCSGKVQVANVVCDLDAIRVADG